MAYTANNENCYVDFSQARAEHRLGKFSFGFRMHWVERCVFARVACFVLAPDSGNARH